MIHVQLALTQVKKGKSGKSQWLKRPASFCGIPLQICMEESTCGVEHLKESMLFSCEAGTGFRTQSRSCSLETIQTDGETLISRLIMIDTASLTILLVLSPIEELVDHVDGRVRRVHARVRSLFHKKNLSI